MQENTDDSQASQTLEGLPVPDEKHLAAWTDYMGSVSRMAPYMGTSSEVSVEDTLQKELGKHVDKTEVFDFEFGKSEVTPFAFYGATRARARVVLVKGVSYDLGMMLVVFTYLTLLWGYVSIQVDGYRGFRQRIPYSLRGFMPKPSGKSR